MSNSKQFRLSTNLFVSLERTTPIELQFFVVDEASPDQLFQKKVKATPELRVEELNQLFEVASEVTTKVLRHTSEEIKLGVSKEEVHWSGVLTLDNESSGEEKLSWQVRLLLFQVAELKRSKASEEGLLQQVSQLREELSILRQLLDKEGEAQNFESQKTEKKDRVPHEVSFEVCLKSFSPSGACIPLCRGQPHPNWVWAFYVFGANSHPNQQGQLQVWGFVKGSNDHQQLSPCYSFLKLNQRQPIRWCYSPEGGGQLWVDGGLVGATSYLGPLDVSRAPKEAVGINTISHKSGRYHTVPDGEVTNIQAVETL